MKIINNCLDKTSKFISSFIMFTYIFLLSYYEITLLTLRQWRYRIVCQWQPIIIGHDKTCNLTLLSSNTGYTVIISEQ